MSETNRNAPRETTEARASAARHIFLSIAVVAVCWVFLRFGSLIVSVAVTHIWEKTDPLLSAYNFMFRQLIMTFLYPSVLNVFRPAFIPLYNEIKKEQGPDQALMFARGVLEIGMIFGLLCFGMLWLFPDMFVQAMAPGFSPIERATSVRMMRDMAPGILCLLFAEMYLILYHAEKKFAYPHGAEAVHKIGWGIGIVVFALLLKLDRRAIGVAYSIACALQLGVNVVGMKRTFGWVFAYSPLVDWGRRWGKRAAWLALPLVIGIVAARLRDLLTLRVQSQLEIVRFNSVELARQLTNLPVAFMGQIVSIVMLPHLASILHSHGRDTHRQTVESTIEILTVIAVPIVALILVLAPEMMSLLFIDAQWNAADATFCREGALAARMMALGFTFLILENILLPGLFSIQSMWWPILWGLAASGFQILCLLALANANLPRTSSLLVAGVAFVYPLSRIFKNGILLLVLRHKTGFFPGRRLPVFLGKAAMLFAGTTGVAYAAHHVCALFLGETRTQADVAVYKGHLVAQLAGAGVITGIGYLALVVAAGYKNQILALLRQLTRRGKTGPVVEDTDPHSADAE